MVCRIYLHIHVHTHTKVLRQLQQPLTVNSRSTMSVVCRHLRISHTHTHTHTRARTPTHTRTRTRTHRRTHAHDTRAAYTRTEQIGVFELVYERCMATPIQSSETQM